MNEKIRGDAKLLTLYNHNLSVCVQKVRLALAEKGLDWVRVDLDLMRGEQLAPEYLKIHPKGLVPALVHDGNAIVESTVILEYLEDAFPDRPLRPASPVERAAMRIWTKIPDDGLHIACAYISFAAAFAEQVVSFHGAEGVKKRIARIPDPIRAARQKELYEKRMAASTLPEHVRLHDLVLGRIEATLADRPWLAGEGFTLADIAILPYVWRLERLNLAQMWAQRPRLADWFARAKARPSWAQAMEAYQSLGAPDYDDNLKAKGVELWPKVQPMLS